jgi:hypothetical protein
MSEPKIDDERPFDLDSPRAVREMNERHCKAAMLMQQLALAGLAELKKKMERNEPLNLSAAEALEMLNIGLKMERDAQKSEEGQPLPKPEPQKRVN